MAEYNNNNRGGGAGGNDRGGNNRGGNDRRGNDRGGRGNDSAVQGDSDFKEKVVAINRVAKVVKGGRRFSFSAIVVVGDGKGNVGYGLGKANEVTDAIAKGIDDARKNVVKVPLYKHTVPHVMEGRYGGGFVLVQPAAAGTGVIAGGAMRAVFESAGIKDVLAKSKGSSNPHNVVKATFAALAKMRDPMQIAQARGISLARVFNG
ncbi:30S ribosomal protein S5 [Hymenobacter ginsengisoli]|uniref:Small ribosomal subunit protein uS5 n=1 Tax=Hymenobacter ginsengisoli TaxID=1051626 RepID=A0ABP8QD14_9BACT|nr:MULTISPECIES: 30S ribosomal protein S5 [unclassified Hymenobacter]MBO2031435.1 30S ribosomal protein S5 [Hymenobacter sp. BT559]